MEKIRIKELKKIELHHDENFLDAYKKKI